MKIFKFHVLPWRNWLARSTVNRKVGGSSPPGSELYYQKIQFRNRHQIATKVARYMGPIMYVTLATHMLIWRLEFLPQNTAPGWA